MRSRRTLSVLLAVFLLVGIGAASAHSHADGQAGAPTCTICQAVETEASATLDGFAFMAVSPESPLVEPCTPPCRHEWTVIEAERARSPPA